MCLVFAVYGGSAFLRNNEKKKKDTSFVVNPAIMIRAPGASRIEWVTKLVALGKQAVQRIINKFPLCGRRCVRVYV